MKALVLAALALLGAAAPEPVQTGPGTQYYAGMPPARYDREIVAVVAFVGDVAPFCGTAPAGLVILACTKRADDGTPIIFMPHPLGAAEHGEAYARVLTHELGHAAGWPSDHPQ